MTTTPPDTPAADTGPRPSRDEIRDLGRLRRSVHDRKVAGVAGGLARHLDIDPVILRVAFVVLTFFGGAGLIVYGACWLLVPEDGSQSATVQLDDKSRTVALIIIGVIAALALVGDSWGAYWFPWPLAIIGLIAFVWLSRNGRGRGGTAGAPAGTPGYGHPAYGAAPAAAAPAAAPSAAPAADASVGETVEGAETTDAPTDETVEAGQQYGPETRQYAGQYGAAGSPYDTGHGGYQGGYQAAYVAPAPRDPRKRGPKLFWFTLALLAVSMGALGIVDLAGVPIVDSAYAALAVGVIGAMLLVGSVIGRAGGLIFLGLIASLGLTAATVADRWDGETIVHDPATSAEVAESYYLEAGEQVLDLSEVNDIEQLDGRTIEISGEVGAIEVIVPEDVDVEVTADVDGPGGYDLFGAQGGGIDWTETASHDGGPGVPSLEIDVRLSVGAIDVRTGS